MLDILNNKVNHPNLFHAKGGSNKKKSRKNGKKIMRKSKKRITRKRKIAKRRS